MGCLRIVACPMGCWGKNAAPIRPAIQTGGARSHEGSSFQLQPIFQALPTVSEGNITSDVPRHVTQGARHDEQPATGNPGTSIHPLDLGRTDFFCLGSLTGNNILPCLCLVTVSSSDSPVGPSRASANPLSPCFCTYMTWIIHLSVFPSLLAQRWGHSTCGDLVPSPGYNVAPHLHFARALGNPTQFIAPL